MSYTGAKSYKQSPDRIAVRSCRGSLHLVAPELSNLVGFVNQCKALGMSHVLLPHVAEYKDEDEGHMSLFVIEFETSMLYHVDPNGLWNNDVDPVISCYTDHVSRLLDLHFVQTTYEINRTFAGIDDGHCVVMSILAGIVATVVGSVEEGVRIINDADNDDVALLVNNLYERVCGIIAAAPAPAE